MVGMVGGVRLGVNRMCDNGCSHDKQRGSRILDGGRTNTTLKLHGRRTPDQSIFRAWDGKFQVRRMTNMAA